MQPASRYLTQHHTIDQHRADDLLFHFPQTDTICLNQAGSIPCFELWQQTKNPLQQNLQSYCFGINDKQQRLCLLPKTVPIPETSTIAAQSLRDFFANQAQGPLAGLAYQLLQWRCDHLYCGRCGELTEDHATEHALYCSTCHHFAYPRINPCVTVLITDGPRILLAKSRANQTQYFGLIAGFIEVGESAEQCAHREVKEEVGLQIKNMRYIDSQSWPFSNALMLGFTAEYQSGDLKIDSEELIDANFYTRDKLPPIAGTSSLSGQLIQKWLNNSL